ncbi:DUF6482 family protein [Catenovulum maritimum]|uniref:Uncharacterized protein n=1 Tax=Catenovulum maritimum TaxID=1513271 RepID=A0A0J8GV27_9ALTE|nr:DUF6482 family protein [Catenovulum maritimum]KMT66640.1 hypothetical protein XM47_00430 [Catenovulum maritimum]
MQHALKSLTLNGADSISVHSFESGIYLLEAMRIDSSGNENSGYVIGNSGHILKCKSLTQVKSILTKIDCNNIWLEAETAYDEMCGLAEKPDTHMKIKISF